MGEAICHTCGEHGLRTTDWSCKGCARPEPYCDCTGKEEE